MTRTTTLLTALATTGLLAGSAHSALILEFEQVGNDVVLTTSGSFDTTGLTESGFSNSLGAAQFINDSGHVQLGSGSNVGANFWEVTRVNSVFSVTPLTGNRIDAEDPATGAYTSNSGTIRLEQNDTGSNNPRIFFSDGINAGDVVTVSSVETFADTTLSTNFGLTAGTTTLWLENSNITSGDAGQVFVTAVPEPGSLALLGLGGLLIGARRRRG